MSEHDIDEQSPPVFSSGQTSINQDAFKNLRKGLLDALQPVPSDAEPVAQGPKFFVKAVNPEKISIDVDAIKKYIETPPEQGNEQGKKSKKEELSQLIGRMNASTFKIDANGNELATKEFIIQTLPAKLDGDNAKQIILEQYVKQNVIKILTIVYAYIVLLEKVNATGSLILEPGVPPGNGPQQANTGNNGNESEDGWLDDEDYIPGAQDEQKDPNRPIITKEKMKQILLQLFGNLYNPFQKGPTSFVSKFDAQKVILAHVFNGDVLTQYDINDLDNNENSVFRSHIGAAMATLPDNLIDNTSAGYNNKLVQNLFNINYNLIGDNIQDKMTKARMLVGLLRRVQYYKAKARDLAAKGGPGANGANDDLLRFVLDTFPLFTKMSTGDVNTIQEKQ